MLYDNTQIKKRKNIENKLKNILAKIIYIIFIPILVYNISLIIQSIINTNKTPSFLGIKTYVIISGSMEPNVCIGDIVIVKETNINELKKGDIISFRKGQSVITHRIERISKDDNEKIIITTKGDNNNAEDSEAINEKNIEGKVIKIIPKIGNVAILVQNKTTILIIILIFYFLILKSNKKRRKQATRRLKRLEYEEKNIKE